MDNLFNITNLKMHYPIFRGFTKTVIGYVKAVNNISFSINQGEIIGVVGESGCGKSTLGNCLIRLIKPTLGSINYKGASGETTDLATLSDRELKFYRKEAQMIFQDPFSSLNPRMTIRDIVGEPLLVNGITTSKSEITYQVGAMLRRVGLRAEYMKRYPHAFSGGQRQRISIARALILKPRFVICDEAVSSLDVSVQAQVIELLKDLQKDFGNTFMFISHDLSVVKHISDRIMVMYLGQIVEICDADELFENTMHPYTQVLIDSVPVIDTKREKTYVPVLGEPGDPSKEYKGCPFSMRCGYTTQICKDETPVLKNYSQNGGEHLVCCHHAGKCKAKM